MFMWARPNAGHLNVMEHCTIIRVCIARQFVRGPFVCSRRFQPLRPFDPEAWLGKPRCNSGHTARVTIARNQECQGRRGRQISFIIYAVLRQINYCSGINSVASQLLRTRLRAQLIQPTLTVPWRTSIPALCKRMNFRNRVHITPFSIVYHIYVYIRLGWLKWKKKQFLWYRKRKNNFLRACNTYPISTLPKIFWTVTSFNKKWSIELNLLGFKLKALRYVCMVLTLLNSKKLVAYQRIVCFFGPSNFHKNWDIELEI